MTATLDQHIHVCEHMHLQQQRLHSRQPQPCTYCRGICRHRLIETARRGATQCQRNED